MSSDAREDFFRDLPPITGFAAVTDPASWAPAPSTWWVALTDVQGSTQAIEQGRYKEVNQLGVACIVGVVNALDRLPVPYVFGGDGATILVPPTRLDATRAALQGLQRLARDAFGLSLRAGLVPIAALQDEGHPVLVAKLRASEHVHLAMLAGSGPSAADAWVKDPVRGQAFAVTEPGPGEQPAVDTSGFECRWRPLHSRRGRVVAVLIKARGDDEAMQRETYRRVLGQLETLLGRLEEASPAQIETLELSTDRADLRGEAVLRRGGGVAAALHQSYAWVENQVGKVLMERGIAAFGFDGAHYPAETVTNTDFRKFDDALRAVLDMNAAQEQALRAFLEAERQAGTLWFGTHAADAALMTCAVWDRDQRHVHFVDGADGGYALAARELKAQVKGS